MKILYILSGTTIYDGATKAIANLIYGLLDKGVEPVVVCPDKNGIFQVFIEKGIKCYATPFTFSSYPGTTGVKNILMYVPRIIKHSIVNVIGYIKILAIVKAERPDIIHTNVSVIDIGYRVAQKLSILHIYHIREYQDLDFNIKVFPSKQTFIDRIKQHKSYAICITRGVSQYFCLNESEAKVIYDGVLPISSKCQIGQKDDYLLYAGRLEENKGAKFVIEAYIGAFKSAKIHTKLLMAGSAPNPSYEVMLKTIASGYPIEFLGMRKDVGDIMKKAKATIVPSFFEGFGFVAAEAMFNGCLVIGRDTAGTKEQFDNGLAYYGHEIGLRFSTEDELSHLLVKVSNADKNEFEEMIQDGQNTVTSLYSVEKHVEDVWEYYHEILRLH